MRAPIFVNIDSHEQAQADRISVECYIHIQLRTIGWMNIGTAIAIIYELKSNNDTVEIYVIITCSK